VEHAQKEKRHQKKNLFAMRTVEFNQAMSEGKGLNRRPFPPRPLTWLALCQCDVVRDQQQKRGHF